MMLQAKKSPVDMKTRKLPILTSRETPMSAMLGATKATLILSSEDGDIDELPVIGGDQEPGMKGDNWTNVER